MGSYQFYDCKASVRFLPIERAVKLTSDLRRMGILNQERAHYLLIAANFDMRKRFVTTLITVHSIYSILVSSGYNSMLVKCGVEYTLLPSGVPRLLYITGMLSPRHMWKMRCPNR